MTGTDESHVKEMESSSRNDDVPVPLTDESSNTDSEKTDGLFYGIEDRPPWPMAIGLALQHFSSSFTTSVALPLIVSRSLCFNKDPELEARLIATMFLVTGIGTILQCLFGVRLPILQGPSSAYLVPILAMLNVRDQPCPADPINVNSTAIERQNLTNEAYSRMQEVQGTLLFAALVEGVVGFTGLIGVILRFIGPITIGVTIFMVGVGIIRVAMGFIDDHWGISLATIALVILFSMVLNKVAVPLPKGRKVHVFALFPIVLAILVMWLFCAILTAAGAFPDDPSVQGYDARVDTESENLRNSAWFTLLYPGQFGAPSFTWAGMIGVLTAVLASMADSIGDYHACAQVSAVPPPPTHAVNRGIGVEAFGVFLGGIFGTPLAVTAHTSSIAVLNLTKVASRRILMLSGVIFIILGFFTKFSALVITIPSPILGAVAIPIAMIAAIGLANFQHVNMENSRNILVIGFSIFSAIALPTYLSQNPGAINTGSHTLDNLIVVLLSSGMFVGAVIAGTLDLLLPGSYEDRGMAWRDKDYGKDNASSDSELAVYNLPFGMEWIRGHKWTTYIPFCPTFKGLYRRDTEAELNGPVGRAKEPIHTINFQRTGDHHI